MRTAGGPPAGDWGGLSWSDWHACDEAHRGNLVPAPPGIYRFGARDEPGLLYIGKGGEAGALARTPGRPRAGPTRHPAGFEPAGVRPVWPNARSELAGSAGRVVVG